MRLLQQWHDHVGRRAAAAQSSSPRDGRAHRAGGQSLPLRHAQSHRPRRATRDRPEREDVMQALTRREFAAAAGGLLLSFSLGPRVALAQDKPRLPGSLETNRMLDAWLRI